MLVVGSLFQMAAFFVQFLELSFPLFVLSFSLGGIGMAFQVGITHENKVGISTNNTSFLHVFRMRLQTPSLQLFKTTLNIKWVLYMLHMVQSSPKFH
jgi:hypothetical protein